MTIDLLPEKVMPGFKHRKNIYTCERCAEHIVTVDLEDGVTPFLIKCESTSGCTGMMKSSVYRVFDQTMRASHEWYRPTLVMRLTDWEQEHVSKGGLLLRRVAKLKEPPPPDLPAVLNGGFDRGWLRSLFNWMRGRK